VDVWAYYYLPADEAPAFMGGGSGGGSGNDGNEGMKGM
jgi:hypothetical protein